MKFSKTLISLAILSVWQPCALAEEDSLQIGRIIDQNKSGTAISCLVMNHSMEEGNAAPQNISLINKATNKDLPVELLVKDRSLCLSNLSFGTEYQVTLKKGLVSSDGLALKQDITESFTTIDHDSSLSFLAGNVLALKDSAKGVGVETINVEKFRASLVKISAEDLASYKNNGVADFYNKWELSSYIEAHGQLISSQVVTPKINKNQKELTILDLNKMSPKELASGIYVLVLTKPNEGLEVDPASTESLIKLIDNSSFALAKSIMISNLGVTTYKSDRDMLVAVRSLTDAKPVKNAKVSLISAANEELATVETDSEGYAKFSGNFIKGKNSQAPVLISVSHDKDFFKLDLREDPLYIKDIKNTLPASLNSDFMTYAYTNRTMVRPGEKIYYEAIVRDSSLKATDLKALKLMIYKPSGDLQEELTLKDPASGAFDYEFSLPKKAMLGDWRFNLGFDKDNILSSNVVVVNNFKPASLEASLKNTQSIVNKSDEVSASVRYIYDSPAEQVPVLGNLYALADNHPVEKYKDYYFGSNDQNSDEQKQYYYLGSKKTDEDGLVAFDFSMLEVADYPQKLKLNLEIADPEGNPLYLQKEYKLAYTKVFPGIKELKKEDSTNSEFSVLVADQAGDLYSGEVSYAIFRRNISYQFVLENGNWKYVSNEYLTPVKTGVVKLTEESKGLGTISTALDNGYYTVRLNYKGAETSANFKKGFVSYDPKYPDRVELFANKKQYRAGDKVTLEFDSAYSGYADLLFKAELKHYEIQKGHNSIEFELKDSFSSGDYAVLSTYAELASKLKGPKRSIGISYIALDSTDKLLELTTDLPAEIKPNEAIDIVVQVPNADADTYVTAALVDKGILQVSNQVPPTPEKYIFGQPKFTLSIYDIYSYLMQKAEHEGQGYGDENAEGQANLQSLEAITKDLFSLYTKKYKVEDGKVKLHFEIPDKSTTATLMLTSWSKDKLGSLAQEVVVKDSAVVSLASPYYMHKGDVLYPNLRIDNQLAKDNSYTYTISCEGAIVCASSGTMPLAGNSANSLAVKLEAKQLGTGEVKLNVQGEGYAYTKTKAIEVLTPFSSINETHIAIVEPNSVGLINFESAFVDKNQPVTVTKGLIPAGKSEDILSSVMEQCCSWGIFDNASSGMAALESLSLIKDDKSKLGKYSKKDIELFIADKLDAVQAVISESIVINDAFLSYTDLQYAPMYVAEFLFAADKAGFNVNKNLLKLLKKELEDKQNSDNSSIAAYALYVLAKNGVNVRSNLIYSFDRIDLPNFNEIDSLTNYAKSLLLYGDTKRAKLALDRAKELLRTLYKKEMELIRWSSLSKSEQQAIQEQIAAMLPYKINSTTHDTLNVIKTSLELKDIDGLDYFYTYLNTRNYYELTSKPLLLAINAEFTSSMAEEKLKLNNNQLSLANKSAERLYATANAYGLVGAYKAGADDYKISKRYYTRDGKELVDPITVNQNDNIIVFEKISSKKLPINGRFRIEAKLPVNMAFVKSLTSYDLENEYGWFDTYGFADSDIVVGDTSMVINLQRYSQYDFISFAYVLKATHTGVSVPLMESGEVKNSAYKGLYYYNKDSSITVK